MNQGRRAANTLNAATVRIDGVIFDVAYSAAAGDDPSIDFECSSVCIGRGQVELTCAFFELLSESTRDRIYAGINRHHREYLRDERAAERFFEELL